VCKVEFRINLLSRDWADPSRQRVCFHISDNIIMTHFFYFAAVIGSVDQQSSGDDDDFQRAPKRRAVTAPVSRRILTRAGVRVERGCGL